MLPDGKDMPALAMEISVFAGAAGMPGGFRARLAGIARVAPLRNKQKAARKSVNVTIDGWITRSPHTVCKRG
jgi:hypothetical protein